MKQINSNDPIIKNIKENGTEKFSEKLIGISIEKQINAQLYYCPSIPESEQKELFISTDILATINSNIDQTRYLFSIRNGRLQNMYEII